MKRYYTFFFSVLILFSFVIKIQAQDDLEKTLSRLSSSAGKAYVNPVISAFGSNLNSGWVSILPPATKLGFHLNVKVIGMGSFFSDDVKKFNAADDFFFSSSQADQILQASGYATNHPAYTTLKNELTKTTFSVNFSGPTIVGSKNDGLKVKFPGKTISSGGQTYTLNPYELSIPEVKGFLDDLKIFPTAAVQATIGTVAGTNVSFRYFPSVNIEDLGKFTFWGVGAIHNPGAWLKNPLPVDIGVGYFMQQMKVGDIFESNASQFGLFVGKTIGAIVSISPYAGFTVESSKTTVKYNYQSNETDISGVPVPPVKVEFELEGENSTAFLVGLNIKLVAININADYKIAKTKTASAGISVGL
ncbi:MAG: hypothetical protein GYA14_04240 [Ignavibacteria bacterium]|nr:hypothetical protein [Ignavibacteria bacterium]